MTNSIVSTQSFPLFIYYVSQCILLLLYYYTKYNFIHQIHKQQYINNNKGIENIFCFAILIWFLYDSVY